MCVASSTAVEEEDGEGSESEEASVELVEAGKRSKEPALGGAEAAAKGRGSRGRRGKEQLEGEGEGQR